MPSVQILNNPGFCSDINSFWRPFCLPIRVNCSPGCRDQILVNSDLEKYNCKKKPNQAKYFMPVLATDKFQLQTVFIDQFHADRENPTTNWGAPGTNFVSAELWDTTGMVSNDVTAFTSRRMVAWNGSYSYQIIEVDVALVQGLITGNCFSITLKSYKTPGSTISIDGVSTQDYIIETGCPETVLIGSQFPKSDCCTSWYGAPQTFVGDNIVYDNTVRYRGSIAFVDGNATKVTQRVDSTIDARKVEIREVYELLFKDAIPDFLAKQLLKVHMAGRNVQIDGETYYIDDFSIQNVLRRSFNFPIELYRFCENKFNC